MGKRAIITGASSGIGRALAIELSKDDWELVLVARRTDQLNDLAMNLPTKTHVVSLDLTDREALEDWIRSLPSTPIDLLVNNAGFGDFSSFVSADWNKLDNMIELNIRALTRLCHAVAPQMVAAGSGAIINVASTAAFMPGPLMAVYFATKAYVLHFSEALGNELSPLGVHVMTLCPGATRTEFATAAGENDLFDANKRLPTAKDVAIFTLMALKKKKIVAVHGWVNRFLIFLVRLTPRKVATSVTRSILEK